VNRENIKKVRDHIAAVEADRFNMTWWSAIADARDFDHVDPTTLLHDCGTAGCIGGWTNALFGGDGAVAAGETLGITKEQRSQLFFAYGTERQLDEITQWHAVAALDHLMETGEVDWDAVFGGAPQ
jgi:hypothetical protein